MYDQNRIPLKRRPIEVIQMQPETDNFLGLGKRARARKDRRFEVRMQKKEAKIADRSYKKHVKADALAKRYSGKAEAGIIQAQGEANANMVLAQQGVANPIVPQPDAGQQLIGAATGILGGMVGGNGNSYGPDQQVEEYEEEDLDESSLGKFRDNTTNPDGSKKSNTMMYIIIAVVVVAGFMFFRKK